MTDEFESGLDTNEAALAGVLVFKLREVGCVFPESPDRVVPVIKQILRAHWLAGRSSVDIPGSAPEAGFEGFER